MLKVVFVMEQHLGHQTYYQNLRRFIERNPQVDATWVPVTYEVPGGAIESLPLLPSYVRGSLRGRQQVLAGLRRPAEVSFFNTQVPAALGGAVTRRRPYVIATDLTPIQYDALGQLYGHNADQPGLLKAYKHRVNRQLLRGAARVLPWSSWARDSLLSDYGVDPRRVEVVPPGVDLSFWQPSKFRPPGPTRILFVGGDFDRKGGPQLVRAFRMLPPGSAELHLVTRSVLPAWPGIFVHNTMSPNTPELLALYQRCDMFVLPTGAEAFGIAAVEASATGLPVIATRVGGLVDVVADGETGYLVSAENEAELAEKLRCLVADASLRARMSRAARARAEVRFDGPTCAARLVKSLIEAVDTA